MKQTVNVYAFRDAFQALRPENFSYDGLGLLFEYFEEMEDGMGEEIELDVIAICCDWAESDAEELMRDYQIDLADLNLEEDADQDAINEALLEYVNDQTSVAGMTDAGTIVYCSW